MKRRIKCFVQGGVVDVPACMSYEEEKGQKIIKTKRNEEDVPEI